MTDGPVAKKVRVWNPALEEDSDKYETSSKSSSPTRDGSFDDQQDSSIDFTKITNPILPMFLQNYLHIAPFMARMQQQQMESLMRQRLISQSIPPSASPIIKPVKPMVNHLPTELTNVPPPPPAPATVSAVNPLVATAMGAGAVNENCCAICGAVFRLTTDLVQHMRNNHRSPSSAMSTR